MAALRRRPLREHHGRHRNSEGGDSVPPRPPASTARARRILPCRKSRTAPRAFTSIAYRLLAHGWQLGSHGLPLMGCGDWNDGMNLVGAGGKGESVWVAWFPGDGAVGVRRASRSCTAITTPRIGCGLRQTNSREATRGTRLGRQLVSAGLVRRRHATRLAHQRRVPHRFASAVVGGNRRRQYGNARQGVDAAMQQLVDRSNPARETLHAAVWIKVRFQPGYIKGYVPGIRENGGQYTLRRDLACASTGRPWPRRRRARTLGDVEPAHARRFS